MHTHKSRLTPRTTLMMVFASFGAAVGALAGSMPVIMRNGGIDSETMGLGLTISTFMTVAAMSLGGQIARFASNRLVLLCIIPAFAILLLAYLTTQSLLWFYIAIVPMGFAFGITDIFMNAEAAAVEYDMKRPVFTSFHACVSAGVACMALIASFLSTAVGTWATGLVNVVLFGAAWIMVFVAIPPRQLARGRKARITMLPNKSPLVLLGIAAGLIIAAETAALMWSAKLLDGLAPSLAAIAGIGAAFYGLCNAAVRMPGDALRARLGDMALMIGSLVVAVAGFAALGMTASFGASVTAFAILGLGTALLIPCIFAVAAGFVPENRAGGLSFVSLLTSVPRVLTPWFFGHVAAGFGISAAFGLVAVGLLAALALVVILSRLEKPDEQRSRG